MYIQLFQFKKILFFKWTIIEMCILSYLQINGYPGVRDNIRFAQRCNCILPFISIILYKLFTLLIFTLFLFFYTPVRN